MEYVEPIAALVRKDFASNAFGNQAISTDEIVIGKLAVGRPGTLVVAAHPKPRVVPSEFDLLWVFERAPSSAVWKNTYLGPPPTCWEGVPESIADAVARTSGIPRCK